ncbi:pyridoxal-phosphate dependent enzyme, partial [Bacillus sp. SIMBA_069]
DARILEAQILLAQEEGVFVEPSAAAGIAGLMKSLEEQRISENDSVVVVLTGHGLKDMGNVHVAREVPTIDDSMEQLLEVLDK